MPRPFPPTTDFHVLALKDLLEAREAYHVHLAHLENVIATAVGLYRIRVDQIPTTGGRPAPTPADAAPRSLANSRVVPGYSWPCVMVFVKRWQSVDDFRGSPDQVIPRRLYLPDGRMVPVCVVLAGRDETEADPIANLNLPGEMIGGGYPVFSDVQGRQHVGSLGCLVSDGDLVYAMTNRHVTGRPGQELYTLLRDQRVSLGTSDPAQAGKLPFQDVYPGWPGTRSFCNMDAGLIQIKDLSGWTAQVFGVGEIGEPIDLNVETFSMDLIGTPVRAFGGVSGPLEGEIQALFYRYKSIGGFDYVADLLIGPRGDGSVVKTRPGDSGTVWFYDPPPAKEAVEDEAHEPRRGARAARLNPIAMQWGGHRLMGSTGEQTVQYALASCVSTVCRVLDVELIRDWNIGLSEYWGKVGHFKIAAKACELVAAPKLKTLLMANQANIAFGDRAIQTGDQQRIDAHSFVPLADVADLVWRTSRPQDESNHFADMDKVADDGPFRGKDLLALCEDPANVDLHVWNQYYESIGENKKRGALPFRIWQIYDDMVRSLRAGDLARFVCAGGLMSHYAGDACQPLHVSQFHHGRTASEKNVHSDYETKMLDKFAADLIARVNQRLEFAAATADVRGGHEAAVAIVALMRQTIEQLAPLDVVDAWVAAAGPNRIGKLWEELGDRTAQCIADGSIRLASLWESAWKEGDGDRIDSSEIGEIDRDSLAQLYRDRTFVVSMTLADMEANNLLGSGESGGEGGAPSRRRRPRRVSV